jgi:hypothetical protein
LKNSVAVRPGETTNDTAATQQNNDNDADDQGGIALFRLFFGGNGHFGHDFFSL